MIIEMDGAETLIVIASDPDDDVVHFTWDYPPDGQIQPPLLSTSPGQDALLYTQTLLVPYDPIYDGEEIQVEITDGDLEDLNQQTVTWILEVE